MSDIQTSLSVLVIEDEAQMRRLLTVTLQADGYHVSTAASGQEGVAAAALSRHDLIILDLDLPDISGIAVLKQLREWTQTPVIVLADRDDDADRVEALDTGADDCVTKPFNSREFLARMRAILRRVDRGKLEKPVFRVGDLEVDFGSRRVTRKGLPVKLTVTEYALLRLFIQHAGKVLTHRHILREVWGPEDERQTQYLRVYMTRLREKLETDPENPVLFLTESGVGYRFAES